MSVTTIEFTQPPFLFCELPIKDGTFNDQRIWIYHLVTRSLIEFVLVNELTDFEFKNKQELFVFGEEFWFGVFVHNNIANTEQGDYEILKGAWNFLREYFEWEDNEIIKQN